MSQRDERTHKFCSQSELEPLEYKQTASNHCLFSILWSAGGAAVGHTCCESIGRSQKDDQSASRTLVPLALFLFSLSV